MKKTKTKKNYQTEVKDGRMTLTLNEKRDGKLVSASCPYPLILQEYNEETEKTEMVKKTKAQTEKFLLQSLGLNP